MQSAITSWASSNPARAPACRRVLGWHAKSVNRQQVSGAISSMPGATMAKMATQTLMYGRFGRSGGGSAQAATAQPRASAARRTDAGADAPVAVIPDPKPQPRSRPGAR